MLLTAFSLCYWLQHTSPSSLQRKKSRMLRTGEKKWFSEIEDNAYSFSSDYLKHKAPIFFKLHADPLLVISEPLFGPFHIPEKRSLPGPKPAGNIRLGQTIRTQGIWNDGNYLLFLLSLSLFWSNIIDKHKYALLFWVMDTIAEVSGFCLFTQSYVPKVSRGKRQHFRWSAALT